MNWSFLFYMMRMMDFSDRWIMLTRGCLELASVSILVNGIPTSKFIAHKAMKGIRVLGVKVGKEGVVVSILQFSMTLYSFWNHPWRIFFASRVFLIRWFELASGLKVNFHKR